MKIQVIDMMNGAPRGGQASKTYSVEKAPDVPKFSPKTGEPVAPVTGLARKEEDDTDPTGQRILVFVHGFGVAEESAVAMTANLAAMLAAGGVNYDHAVTVIWNAKAPFFRAENRADDLGEGALLRQMRELLDRGNDVDLVGHSLGCRPVLALLKAMGDKGQEGTVRNTILLAAAVRDELLDEGKLHHESPVSTDYLYVAHSSRDLVINAMYRIARFTGGMGGGGPERFWKRLDNEDDQLIASNVIVVDCTEVIDDHGDYFNPKIAQPVFDWLAADLLNPDNPQGPRGRRIEA